MPSLGDIFQQYGPAYLQQHGDRVLPGHRKAIGDISRCRTADMESGGVYRCQDCGDLHYAYRSCGNRHCPRCGHHTIDQRLHRQQGRLLLVNYFLVTFTLPHELHALAYAHQRQVYDIMFAASSQALKELAMDRRFLGGHIGMLGVLHTWKRNLDYHPHVHYLVPGGGLSPDRRHWLYPRKRDFLVHVKPLGRLYRGKVADRLEEIGLHAQVPPQAWAKDWIVDCRCVGDGRRSLRYLGPYVQRVALSDRRICDVSDDTVTIRYQPSRSEHWKTRTLPALLFIALFLKHVLPRGFVKVRSYGLLAPAWRLGLHALRLLLLTSRSQPPQPPPPAIPDFQCPRCGGTMRRIGFFNFARPPPP